MIEWERRVRLRHYLEQGYTQLEIAERLGISRRTIYRWIRSGQLDRDLDEPPRYGPRPKQARKLDPYREYVRQRLADFPDLTAVRLCREIRASGYTGGLTRLPAVKTLADFDFSFQPSIKREQIESLHELGFISARRT